MGGGEGKVSYKATPSEQNAGFMNSGLNTSPVSSGSPEPVFFLELSSQERPPEAAPRFGCIEARSKPVRSSKWEVSLGEIWGRADFFSGVRLYSLEEVRVSVNSWQRMGRKDVRQIQVARRRACRLMG